MNRPQREPGLLWPAIWRLALATGVVQAQVQPAADGFVVRPEDRGRILAERHLAYHPSSGRALIVRAGRLEVQETRLLHRICPPRTQ